jgi:aldose 1-epimerase
MVRLLFVAGLLFCTGPFYASFCSAQPSSTQTPRRTFMKIETASFGQADGQPITRYTLVNSKGHKVSLMNFGATLLEVEVPDRDGNLANVNLAFDNLQDYVDGHPYFGSTVGRFCNRIGNASFTIDGTEYPLVVNHGKHQLHGGKKNFSYQVWKAETYESDQEVGVKFTLQSPAGDNGFPGNVTATADYSWNDNDELKIVYSATTDQPTHVNLTNHSYWNLGGVGSGTAKDHVATIEADQFLDVDEDLIPTGKFNDVADTPLDFRSPTPLGERIDQLPATKGYDHCYVVRGQPGTLRKAGIVVDPDSGRTLEIETTQPGMQLYTANHLGGGPKNAGAGSHDAFCLETQHYPDAPNRPEFPSTLLKPGETMSETTIHRFGIDP